jgi:hypothetical protein
MAKLRVAETAPGGAKNSKKICIYRFTLTEFKRQGYTTLVLLGESCR